MKVIGVCGLGFTGSGAVTDLLREYDEITYDQHFHEFSLCYYTDGLLDLKHHLCDSPIRFESSDSALYRFDNLIRSIYSGKHLHSSAHNKELYDISQKYLDDITQVKWKGTWGFRLGERDGLRSFITKVLFKVRPIIGDKPYIYFTDELMRFSIRPEEFNDKTVAYVENILNTAIKANGEYVLLDQAFPGDHPEICFPFFKDPKAIVVDRDPRDVFLLSKYDLHADSSWIPTKDVQQFIYYYSRMRECANLNNSDRVLHVQYEELIYNYENAVREIESFLNISNHSLKGKYLRIEDSIYNTQLFNKYPQEADNIKCIEDELHKWIFNFNNYRKVVSNRKTW